MNKMDIKIRAEQCFKVARLLESKTHPRLHEIIRVAMFDKTNYYFLNINITSTITSRFGNWFPRNLRK